ncbi:MAG: hypothetical protein ACE5NC_06160, partial [Anaerolineae bacterium]
PAMRPATSSSHRTNTPAWRSLGMQGFLLSCLLAVALFAAGGCADSGDGRGEGAEADAVWFARYTMQAGGLGYVGVTEDGTVLVVEGIGHPGDTLQDPNQVRTGSIEAGLRDRLFRIASDDAVYAARVEGPGELLFYEGVLLRIGSRLGGTMRAADLVPMSDLPQEAREILGEVVAWSRSLLPDPEVRLLLSAEAVAPDRAEGIRSDPRDFYSFVALGGTDLQAAPALAHALDLPGLLVAVPDAAEGSQIQAWQERSNPDGVGSYFFLETSDGIVYQIHTLWVGPS